MRVWYCDHFEVPLPAGHRFPMHKYRALREALLSAGLLRPDELVPAEPIDAAALRRVHAAAYVDALFEGTLSAADARRLGLPWSRALLDRSRASVGATLAAAAHALDQGFAGNLSGGTHHAHHDFGSGYCVFNDLAVAAVALHDRGRIRRALVFDVDVHQGDGTAALFAGDDRVYTCSLHGARNFPFRKHASDLDVDLPDGTDDAAYLDHLRRAWAHAVDAARPDLVLVQGGVDPLASDTLGRLSLTHAGLEARDRFIFEAARRLGVPVALTLGGGYADPIDDTITAHLNTYRVAREVFG